MRLLSLFSGIGAFEKALDKLKKSYELVGFSEIDEYAIKSYCAIHKTDASQNLGDITKINEKNLQKNIDLITYGFPCQDISNAGKQKGLFNQDGTKTRSGLFFEALRIIQNSKPKVAIAENVRNLTSKKFSKEFKIVLDSLEAAGYNNYWKILNSKNYEMPQNRDRVFIISIRKDADTGRFKFPDELPLILRLKDLLEKEVDEKYYMNGFDNSIIKDFDVEAQKIIVSNNTKKGFTEAFEGDSINFEFPNSKTRRGRVGHQVAQTLTTSPQQAVVVKSDTARILKVCQINSSQDGVVVSPEGIAPTHTAGHGNCPKIMDDLGIRKLTPKECFRLMGFEDSDFEAAEKVAPASQLYKQAGNSIVVNVLYYIFKALFEANIFDQEGEE